MLSDPFTGMRYLDAVVHGCITARWVGSMEAELHEAIEEAIVRAPRFVANLGSAEVYYAVGFARRLPEARLSAFEIDPWARRTLKRACGSQRGNQSAYVQSVSALGFDR